MTTDSTASSATAATDATDAVPAAAAQKPVAAATTNSAPAPAEITLRQFAIELSARDKRVALLHGFRFEEEQARRFKDTEANYLARFAMFANKPV